MNDRFITNARFIKVNRLPQIDSHLTAKLYVDNAISNNIHESSLLRLHPNEKLEIDKQDSIIPNSTLSEPKTIIELQTKAYIDSLHDDHERNRRELESNFYAESSVSVKNKQDNDPNDKQLTNVKSIIVDQNPILDYELSNKKYIDDEIDENTIVRINDDSNEKYLQVRVENTAYKLQIYNKTTIIDTTIIKYPNTGGYYLQQWNIKCNDKNGNGKNTKFYKINKNKISYRL